MAQGCRLGSRPAKRKEWSETRAAAASKFRGRSPPNELSAFTPVVAAGAEDPRVRLPSRTAPLMTKRHER